MTIRETLLERLLDQAHAAVKAADFAALASLGADLDAALAGFDPQGNVALSKRLHAKAQRNAAGLSAAARGVRSALRRAEEVRRVATGLVTYDGKGKRAESSSAGQLSRRF